MCPLSDWKDLPPKSRRSRPSASTAGRLADPQCGARCRWPHRERDADAGHRSGYRRVQGPGLLLWTSEAFLLPREVARLRQKFCRLSSTPNNVLKIVESAKSTSPARFPVGGIQRNMLNSLFPASMKGWGLERSRSEE